MLSIDDQKLLDEYVLNLSRDKEIVGIIFHGSALHSNKYNDIDIALIPKNPQISSKQKLKFILKSPDKFDVRFLRDFSLHIAKNVIKGKLLMNKDYNCVFDEYIQVIKDWEMFRPSWELYMDVCLNGL